MKTKYEKPMIMGIQESTAEGQQVDVCWKGSFATGDPRTVHPNCHPNGYSASGALCGNGDAVFGCDHGNVPGTVCDLGPSVI